MDVEGQLSVAVPGRAGHERVEQPPTGTAATGLGDDRDDEFGRRGAARGHEQRQLPEVPPDRPDRAAAVVERQHARPR